MFHRTFDGRVINALMNHEAVRPWVLTPGMDAIDVSAPAANPRNVVLVRDDEKGGVFFDWHEPGVYEAHTQFLPEVRGRDALETVADMLRWMFTRTDCMEVRTRVPAHNRAAAALMAALARRTGAVLDFRRSKAWPTENGPVDVTYWSLRYPDWVRATRDLMIYGQWFHEELEAEKERVGSPHVVHDDDDAHDLHVGATVAMIMGGQVAKALALYNRWARFAGYAPAAVVSTDPLIIDIQEAWLAVEPGNSIRIVRCLQQQ